VLATEILKDYQFWVEDLYKKATQNFPDSDALDSPLAQLAGALSSYRAKLEHCITLNQQEQRRIGAPPVEPIQTVPLQPPVSTKAPSEPAASFSSEQTLILSEGDSGRPRSCHLMAARTRTPEEFEKIMAQIQQRPASTTLHTALSDPSKEAT